MDSVNVARRVHGHADGNRRLDGPAHRVRHRHRYLRTPGTGGGHPACRGRRTSRRRAMRTPLRRPRPCAAAPCPGSMAKRPAASSRAPSQRVRPGGRYRGADRKPGGSGTAPPGAPDWHPRGRPSRESRARKNGLCPGRRQTAGRQRRRTGRKSRTRRPPSARRPPGGPGPAPGRRVPATHSGEPRQRPSASPRGSAAPELLPHGFGKIPSGAVSALRTT